MKLQKELQRQKEAQRKEAPKKEMKKGKKVNDPGKVKTEKEQ